MEVSNLIRVEYHGEAVLSTKQIADAYECSPGNIRWNFAKNADKFVEGVHYFKLEGAALREFKEYVSKIWAQFSRADGMENFQSAEINEAGKSRSLEFPFGKTASAVIIWTLQGAARHCKMLGTQKAWEVFSVLENSYFGQKVDLPEIETPFEMDEDAENLPQPPLFNLSDEIEILMKLLDYTGNQELRDRIIIKIAEKILGEKLF